MPQAGCAVGQCAQAQGLQPGEGRAGQDGVFLCRNLLLPVPSSGLAPACFHWATQGTSVLETCPGAVTMQGSHQERPWELARGRVPWEENGEGSFSWPRSPCRGSARSWGSFLGSGASFFLLLHLWLPSGAPQAAAGAGLLCQSVLPWSVHACGTHGQECWLGLGLQDCECCFLGSAPENYSNFPTIKSAVECECSVLCCVSVLD